MFTRNIIREKNKEEEKRDNACMSICEGMNFFVSSRKFLKY